MYLGYTLALQSICSDSLKKTLDRVQNGAVKFISGGMRSTPVAACEIDCNIEPLELRREAAVLEMVERYRRAEDPTPNRSIIDNWRPNERIKQKSILKVEKKLQEKHHLPEFRETQTPLSKDTR
ncbi:MAG: hypothetical protein HRT74_12960, partial [Flavobacteriales bacterium]|nr:hypothetical protein [Flavobacteriales bacterium]